MRSSNEQQNEEAKKKEKKKKWKRNVQWLMQNMVFVDVLPGSWCRRQTIIKTTTMQKLKPLPFEIVLLADLEFVV